MPESNARVPGQAHRAAVKPAVEQRLAGAQHDRDHGRDHLVEQARVSVLRGDVPAADDPDVALPGCVDYLRVKLSHTALGESDIDVVARGTDSSRVVSTQKGLFGYAHFSTWFSTHS